MTEIRYCVGGPKDRPCVSFNRHAEGCPNEGIPDDQPQPCRGCAPRHATEGHLCATCDTYLRQLLIHGVYCWRDGFGHRQGQQ